MEPPYWMPKMGIKYYQRSKDGTLTEIRDWRGILAPEAPNPVADVLNEIADLEETSLKGINGILSNFSDGEALAYRHCKELIIRKLMTRDEWYDWLSERGERGGG